MCAKIPVYFPALAMQGEHALVADCFAKAHNGARFGFAFGICSSVARRCRRGDSERDFPLFDFLPPCIKVVIEINAARICLPVNSFFQRGFRAVGIQAGNDSQLHAAGVFCIIFCKLQRCRHGQILRAVYAADKQAPLCGLTDIHRPDFAPAYTPAYAVKLQIVPFGKLMKSFYLILVNGCYHFINPCEVII